MKRVFIDANIVVDLLCERYPWFPDTLRLFSLADLGKIELYCSALSLGTASFLMERKKMASDEIFENISWLCELCTPSPVDAAVVKDALASGFADFEDALQYFSATKIDADCIVTRNKKDFASSELPVYEPAEFLSIL